MARDAVKTRLIHHDGEQGLEHVEIDFLRHHPDARLGRLEFPIHVVAEDFDGSAGLVHERRDNTDDGGLARTVGTE